MSAPLVVNTADGSCWVRRALTREGHGLYALAGSVAGVPDGVLMSLSELAVHGITGSADVLPMPVGPEPEALTAEQLVAKMCDALNGHECPPPDESPMGTVTRFAVRLMEAERQVAELDALGLGDLDGRRSACCGKPNHPTWLRKTDDTRACPWCVMELQSESLVARTHQLVHYQEIERNFWGNQRADESRAAVANLRIVELNRERDALKARIAALELERHSTNDALDDAVALGSDEPAPKCRCDEPDADPYSCEADDCTGHFSELNPFGGGSGPVEGHDAKVSRTCGKCDFRTSVWHVADGSAEEELHRHTVRVHGGQPVAGA